MNNEYVCRLCGNVRGTHTKNHMIECAESGNGMTHHFHRICGGCSRTNPPVLNYCDERIATGR